MVNDHFSTLDSVFSALADPTRRAILARLAQGQHAVSRLAEPHDMSLPAVTKHLDVLERAGLIRREKAGRIVFCRLEAAPMREANEWLNHYQQFWRGQLDSLARYLNHPDPEESPWPPSSNPRAPRSGSRASTRTRAKKSSARGPTRKR